MLSLSVDEFPYQVVNFYISVRHYFLTVWYFECEFPSDHRAGLRVLPLWLWASYVFLPICSIFVPRQILGWMVYRSSLFISSLPLVSCIFSTNHHTVAAILIILFHPLHSYLFLSIILSSLLPCLNFTTALSICLFPHFFGFPAIDTPVKFIHIYREGFPVDLCFLCPPEHIFFDR